MAKPERQLIGWLWRFTPVAAIALATAMILAGLLMALYSESVSKAEKLRDVSVQANILSASVTAALAFDDVKLAQEYVDALGANRDVQAAGVYDLHGNLVAAFAREGARPPMTNTVRAPFMDGDSLVVSRPVVQGSTMLGSVYLRTFGEPFGRRVARYGGTGLLIIMAALIVLVLGLANASLAQTQRRLRVEMEQREKTEQALRLSREMEAIAQLEIATQRSRAALAQSERQLEFALQAGRLGSWAIDLSTGEMTVSEFFKANFGLGPDVLLTREADLAQYIHAEDRELELASRVQAIADGTDLDVEYRTLSPDGELRWILVRGQAFFGEDGFASRMVGISLDITARKFAEERQRLLVDELNHRVKNTLATVQSIAMQTRRGSQTLPTFEAAFLSRLDALAGVHDLLSQVSWEGASLAAVVRETLAPHLGEGEAGQRLDLSGPDVRLGPNAAVTLTMAFHELATNAAKYGALSVGTGKVEVHWRADDVAAPSEIEITWRELGGPAVRVPARKGFGTRFLERGLAREFDGIVVLEFAPGGVCCRMRMPLSVKLRMAA
jgi:PAS domain S-box-containing protein